MERDAAVAVVVLANFPLDPFGDEVFAVWGHTAAEPEALTDGPPRPRPGRPVDGRAENAWRNGLAPHGRTSSSTGLAEVSREQACQRASGRACAHALFCLIERQVRRALGREQTMIGL
ncbi:hypothetical protein [Streptomyces sp. NPDC006668]|uniref:hypothetical protein n=1 Tax=Streptomyces sp. NPDC006668 TaxID=3156903 RepID=UPI003410382E